MEIKKIIILLGVICFNYYAISMQQAWQVIINHKTYTLTQEQKNSFKTFEKMTADSDDTDAIIDVSPYISNLSWDILFSMLCTAQNTPSCHDTNNRLVDALTNHSMETIIDALKSANFLDAPWAIQPLVTVLHKNLLSCSLLQCNDYCVMVDTLPKELKSEIILRNKAHTLAWNTITNHMYSINNRHSLKSLALNNNGTCLATIHSSTDSNVIIQIRSLKKSIANSIKVYFPISTPECVLALSPDGKWRTHAKHNNISLFSLAGDGKCINFPYNHSVRALAFSHDSQKIAATNYLNQVHIWDLETHKCKKIEYDTPSPDNATQKHPNLHNILVFSPDDTTVIINNKKKLLWVNIDQANVEKTIEFPEQMNVIAYNPYNDWIATQHSNQIKLLDLTTMLPLYSFDQCSGQPLGCFSLDGTILAIGESRMRNSSRVKILNLSLVSFLHHFWHTLTCKQIIGINRCFAAQSLQDRMKNYAILVNENKDQQQQVPESILKLIKKLCSKS